MQENKNKNNLNIDQKTKAKKGMKWSAIVIIIILLFCGCVYVFHGIMLGRQEGVSMPCLLDSEPSIPGCQNEEGDTVTVRLNY